LRGNDIDEIAPLGIIWSGAAPSHGPRQDVGDEVAHRPHCALDPAQDRLALGAES
jgi:hypothetical protein